MKSLNNFLKENSLMEAIDSSRFLNENDAQDWKDKSMRDVAKNISTKIAGTTDQREIASYLRMMVEHCANIYNITPEQAWLKCKIYFPKYSNMDYNQISNNSSYGSDEGAFNKILSITKNIGIGDTLGKTLASKLTNYRKTGRFGS